MIDGGKKEGSNEKTSNGGGGQISITNRNVCAKWRTLGIVLKPADLAFRRGLRRERAVSAEEKRGRSLASHELASIHPFPLNKPGCCNLAQCRALAIAREPYYFIGSSLFPSIRVCDISLVRSTAPTFLCPTRASIFFLLLYSPSSLSSPLVHTVFRVIKYHPRPPTTLLTTRASDRFSTPALETPAKPVLRMHLHPHLHPLGK